MNMCLSLPFALSTQCFSSFLVLLEVSIRYAFLVELVTAVIILTRPSTLFSFFEQNLGRRHSNVSVTIVLFPGRQSIDVHQNEVSKNEKESLRGACGWQPMVGA